MKINEIKDLQANGIKMEELKQSIKTIAKEYSHKCDLFSSRFSLKLTNIALLDIQNFLNTSGLKYSMITNNRFKLDGTDIEFIVEGQGFTFGNKSKYKYKTFLIESVEANSQIGFVYKNIRYKGDLLSVGIEYILNEKLKQIDNIEDLNEIYQSLNSAMNDVINAEDLLNVDITNYEYYEYENETNRYKTINEIVEKEL